MKLNRTGDYKTISKFKNYKQVEREAQIWMILWQGNNWMSPNDGYRVTDSKAAFEYLNLSTEIQFSTDVVQVSPHPVWVVSSSKKTEAYLGSWHLCSDDDTCERSNTPEFQIKELPNFFQILYLCLFSIHLFL